ncbi:MAG: flavin reductase family protein, partial [Planctomycetota bacterium]
MDIEPAALSPSDRYKLLIGTIVPRPIALVSTIGTDGQTNLAPFSFFNGVGSNPMTVMFCPASHPDGSDKDTLRHARPVDEGGTGEFVINLAIEDYVQRVAAAAEPLPPHESEFDLSGLTPSPSVIVAPPRVAESPVVFECRTTMIVQTNPGAAGGGNLVLGEVVHMSIRDDLVNERWHVDQAALRAVGRMGGRQYA